MPEVTEVRCGQWVRVQGNHTTGTGVVVHYSRLEGRKIVHRRSGKIAIPSIVARVHRAEPFPQVIVKLDGARSRFVHLNGIDLQDGKLQAF